MPPLDKPQMVQWVTNKATHKLSKVIDEWEGYTLSGEDIYIEHYERGGLRVIRCYNIPRLVDKVLAAVTIDSSMNDAEIKAAIVAALPNQYLIALLDELLP